MATLKTDICWWFNDHNVDEYEIAGKSCRFNDSDYVVNSIWHFGGNESLLITILRITTKMMAPWGRMKDLVWVSQKGDQHSVAEVFAFWHILVDTCTLSQICQKCDSMPSHISLMWKINMTHQARGGWCDASHNLTKMNVSAKHLWSWPELESALRLVNSVQHCSEA